MLKFRNNKRYIGITTKTVEKRFDNHRRSAMMNNSQLAVHRAWRKYGEPEVNVLVIAYNDYLPELEIKAISVFNTLVPNGYNFSFGGEISPMLNPMIAAKVSKINKGMPAAFKGRRHTDESKQKQRFAKLGKKHTDEHRAKIAAAGIGRIPLDETRKKISLANTGKSKSEDHRKKLSESLTKAPLEIVDAVELQEKGRNGKRLWSTCKHGHELSGNNLRITTEGKYMKRRCNECSRLRTQKYRSKNNIGIFAL